MKNLQIGVRTKAQEIAGKAEDYRLQKCYEQALLQFSQAIEIQPDYSWAIAHRGEVYRQMKWYEKSLFDFNQSIILQPSHFWAIAHRGATYFSLQDYPAALEDFDRAMALKKDYAWALMYRANCYVALKEYETALSDLDRAIAIDNRIIPSWQGERGLLLSYMYRYAEAIEYCKLGLVENPDDYIAWYTLTVTQFRWKGLTVVESEIATTRKVLETALERDGRTGGILYRLAGLAALEGDEEQALILLREAVIAHEEPRELMRHDLAWLEWRDRPQFNSFLDSQEK
ncbi:MAG: tetratricopeptide repeat protein [Cyanobacteria bacterium P01_E01_bin.42]